MHASNRARCMLTARNDSWVMWGLVRGLRVSGYRWCKVTKTLWLSSTLVMLVSWPPSQPGSASHPPYAAHSTAPHHHVYHGHGPGTHLPPPPAHATVPTSAMVPHPTSTPPPPPPHGLAPPAAPTTRAHHILAAIRPHRPTRGPAQALSTPRPAHAAAPDARGTTPPPAGPLAEAPACGHCPPTTARCHRAKPDNRGSPSPPQRQMQEGKSVVGTTFVVLRAKLACNHHLRAVGSTSESSKQKPAATAWLRHRYRVYGGTTTNCAS